MAFNEIIVAGTPSYLSKEMFINDLLDEAELNYKDEIKIDK